MRVPNFTAVDAIAIGLDPAIFKFPKAGIPITREGLQKQSAGALAKLVSCLSEQDERTLNCTRFLPANPAGCWVCQSTDAIDAILLLLTGDVE